MGDSRHQPRWVLPPRPRACPGAERGWPETITLPVAVGFLGAFTTFSTFSYETYTLARTDRIGTAAVYVAVSLVGGVLAVAAGYATARAL